MTTRFGISDLPTARKPTADTLGATETYRLMLRGATCVLRFIKQVDESLDLSRGLKPKNGGLNFMKTEPTSETTMPRTKMKPQETTNFREFFTIDEVLLKYQELLAHAKKLQSVLKDAAEHLDYCGYGDRWERECAQESKLPQRIEEVLAEWDASNLSK